MKPLPNPNQRGDQLLGKIEELRAGIQKMDPARLADRVGGHLVENRLSLPLWGDEVTVSFPEVVATGQNGQPLRPDLLALLFYHLHTTNGAPISGRWISFHDLPEGKFYASAFQGYTGAELVRGLKTLASFTSACERAGGERIWGAGIPGEAAFRFWALPRIPLLAAFWEGDEDFPANAQVLFDASASQHLPADAYAIVGSTLVRKILKAGG